MIDLNQAYEDNLSAIQEENESMAVTVRSQKSFFMVNRSVCSKKRALRDQVEKRITAQFGASIGR